MVFRRLRPHPLLRPFVEKMWVFESETGIPPGDMRTVVPNGLFKVIVSYQGSLASSSRGGTLRVSPEGSISLIGLMEQPVTIDSRGPTGSIGIEFKPSTAYRFFPFRLQEVTNRVELFSEVLGPHARALERRLADLQSVQDKVGAVDEYLVGVLASQPPKDPLVEWTVSEILRTRGTARISDLSERTGYSRRYLDLRFSDHVGISPKLLSGIVRFQSVFTGFARRKAVETLLSNIPDRYYDQSHFIREFRRFSGRSPGAYLNAPNDFGEIFYKES